ncbi:hypothetical protein E3T54_11910 [Cryobacterium sp. Sr8]|uniref:metallophosphoesterase family protein n=1 Tax=Cryobacterium sp. Sr8 TaxID=1259203 RepID=UPI00106D5799|nr:metallophosphoesterase [Cryobacterium sp. Sr8]TFD75431.1 hypothetical protein E3T54_11910 [Cryobacterium sp. Sr8]
MYAAQTLSTARRVGLLGDLHGDIHHLREVSELMSRRGIRVLVQLGDFGFVDAKPERSNLGWASEILAENGQSLFFVDGNYDQHEVIYGHPIRSDGIRWLAVNIGALPRAFRTTVGGRRSFVALGGANSIDHPRARPLEAITPDDLVALGSAGADVMVGHDAPAPFPTLDRLLAKTDRYWSADGLAYAAEGRAAFTRGFMTVRPSLYLGSHFHTHLDEVISFGRGADRFETRVVLLDSGGSRSRVSQAILDLATLELSPFRLNGGK